jgi:hypothetical protein
VVGGHDGVEGGEPAADADLFADRSRGNAPSCGVEAEAESNERSSFAARKAWRRNVSESTSPREGARCEDEGARESPGLGGQASRTRMCSEPQGLARAGRAVEKRSRERLKSRDFD